MTVEQAKRLFNYDPVTGHLTWTSAAPHPTLFGKRAGSVWDSGYIIIRYGEKTYRAHRVIWTWMTGEPPVNDIDHQDLCRSNNVWKNLRAATRRQNLHNTGPASRNTSGAKGVSRCSRTGRWRARITVDGREQSLGVFADKADAIAAYAAGASRLRGQFGRTA